MENEHIWGGDLSLDFTNTIGSREDDDPSEKLNSFSDLLSWSLEKGLLSDRAAGSVSEEAGRRPREAAEVFRLAINLREAIYRIFLASVAGRPPAQADLESLNGALFLANSHLRLESNGGDFFWNWAGDGQALDQMLWPIARSAAELLTSNRLARVGQCESDTCDWLFIDKSRNHSRRWCDMGDCGNRAKARRHYHRKKAGKSG